MANPTGTFTRNRSSSKVWQIGVWVAQIALCLMFGMGSDEEVPIAPRS